MASPSGNTYPPDSLAPQENSGDSGPMKPKEPPAKVMVAEAGMVYATCAKPQDHNRFHEVSLIQGGMSECSENTRKLLQLEEA